jgi:flagellar hook-length control protein FliK
MITLQQLLSSDIDLSGGALGGKAAEGGQDFLALLAGALTDAQGQGKGTALTLGDLQAAGGKLSKAALQKGDESLDAATLKDLLASKDIILTDDNTQQGSLQGLISGLMPAGKTDVLKSLTQAAKEADSKSELSDEELAGLSALMAMLPHQQASAVAAPQASGSDTLSTQVPITGANTGHQPALETDAQRTGKHVAQDQSAALSGNNQLSPTVAAVATKQEIDSTPSPTVSGTPTASLAPVLNTANAAQPTQAATPVVSAPLGSQEWQQSVSQHITLFTKQGQNMVK